MINRRHDRHPYLAESNRRRLDTRQSRAYIHKTMLVQVTACNSSEEAKMTSTTSALPEDFTAVLHVPAGPDTVSGLFTSAAGVSRWWGPTEGDGAVGGTLVTSFGDYGVNAMRVLAAGPTRVVWQPIAPAGTTPTGHTQEWLGTTMEFDFVPAGTGTELRFRHCGLTPQLECWDSCAAAWTYFMASIETFATTGTGTPFGF
jgi:hypothetical protein